MKYFKKQTYIDKFNFADGDNFAENEIPGSTSPAETGKLEKSIYKQLKKILKNYSENLPPLYLVDRRTKRDNTKYNNDKRHLENSDRRKLQRRKNNFDRRHPQRFDLNLSYLEEDRRKEFSDRRDWLEIERRNIDLRKTIKSTKKIAELIASYKIQIMLNKENTTPKAEEILLLIKTQLTEDYHFKSEELVFDLLTELNSFMQGEKFFCGKLSDNSLGFFYYWMDGKKKYFIKQLGKKEFPAKLKIVPNYRTDKIRCCVDFDPFDNSHKCNAGICNQYTSKTKRRLQRAEILKTFQDKLKISR